MTHERSGTALLEVAVEALQGEPLAGLTARALSERMATLQRQVGRLQADVVRTVAAFDAVHGYAAFGSGSTTAHIQAVTRLTGHEASQIVDTARGLSVIEGGVAALQSGAITPGHAAAMARHVREVGPDLAREASALLLAAARIHDATEVRALTQHLRQELDPGGAARDFERVRGRRRLDLGPCADGSFHLDANLDPEAGEVMRTAIDLFSRPVTGDTRSAAQRRHDALAELVRRGLGRDDSGSRKSLHGQRANVTLLMPLSALEGGPGAAAVRLGRSTVVPEATWRRLLCSGTLRSALVDEAGEVVRCGPMTRSIPAATEQAVALRDGGCTFPAPCDRPLTRCEPHHLRERQHGGRNDESNLTMLCDHHHRRVHDGGWTLERLDDGSMLAVGALGERLHGPPRDQWSAAALAARRRRRPGDAPAA